MFDGVKESLRKRKEEGLIRDAFKALERFKEFSLQNPTINTTYNDKVEANAVKLLENIKKVMDARGIFDEGKKSPKTALKEEAELDYSPNGFLQDLVYAKISDEKLRKKLEEHLRAMQIACVQLFNYLENEYKPDLSGT